MGSQFIAPAGDLLPADAQPEGSATPTWPHPAHRVLIRFDFGGEKLVESDPFSEYWTGYNFPVPGPGWLAQKIEGEEAEYWIADPSGNVDITRDVVVAWIELHNDEEGIAMRDEPLEKLPKCVQRHLDILQDWYDTLPPPPSDIHDDDDQAHEAARERNWS